MKCVTVDSFDVRRRQDRLFASKAFALHLCLDIKAIYIDAAVSFPQLEELISPHMCRPKPRINEEKQVVDVLYISGRFAP